MDVSSLDSFLNRRSLLQIWMIGMALVACAGVGDYLTRISNARAFKDEARRLLTLSGRHNRLLTLGFIDLDNFKSVNDRKGHSEGDRVHFAVASTLTNTVRSSDVVGRLGGDEFSVLMPETGFDDAKT